MPSKADLADLVEGAAELVKHAKAKATTRAYEGDWRRFSSWCAGAGFPSRPSSPSTVALYIAHLERLGRKVSTIQRALVAISQAHQLDGHPTPTTDARVREVLKGLRRKNGVAPERKQPIVIEDLRLMVGTLDDTPAGARDRALLTLGFSMAARRSELVALNVENLVFTVDGIEVTIKRSKTDQEGEGAKVGVPYGSDRATCPVRSVRAWLDFVDDTGPIFRRVLRGGRNIGAERLGARAVALVVKRAAKRAGLDPDGYAGHSLRAGLATSAAKAGKSERAIMRQGRWRSVEVARTYIRDGELFTDNAAAGIGL